MSFYRFPKDPARRALWISAVGRKNWTPNAYSWICSAHFVSGEKSDDPLSPGYVPTLFAHTGSPVKRKAVGDLSRYRRSQAADLLDEDILKLEDELQLLSSENCRLKNSECLTEASFLENNAKVKGGLHCYGASSIAALRRRSDDCASMTEP